MFSVDLDSAIQFLVDSKREPVVWGWNIFQKNTHIIKRKALYLKFEVSVRNLEYSDDESELLKDDNLTCPVHMIFFGDTSVFFYADKERKFYGFPDAELFENTSNHDSCWRSDGFRLLHQLYFDMCEAVAPEKASVDLDSTGSWLLWTEMKDVWVSYERNSARRYELITIEEDK